MPDNRHLLHHTKADSFASWAVVNHGYRREETKGDYEALRLRKGKSAPLIYYRRNSADHLTCQWGEGARLVRRWLRERDG